MKVGDTVQYYYMKGFILDATPHNALPDCLWTVDRATYVIWADLIPCRCLLIEKISKPNFNIGDTVKHKGRKFKGTITEFYNAEQFSKPNCFWGIYSNKCYRTDFLGIPLHEIYLKSYRLLLLEKIKKYNFEDYG